LLSHARPAADNESSEIDANRLVRAIFLLLLGLCVASGAALSDIYLHRGVESGSEQPYVVQPTGRDLATNLDLSLFPASQYDSIATVLQTSGFRFVRQHFSWSAIEPTKGEYSWTAYDAMVVSLAAHGIKVVAVLDGSPAWSRDPSQTSYLDAPPANVDDYAAFVSEFVKHYSDSIQFVQIWDLPNRAEHWGGVPATPGGYVKLLTSAFNASRSANSETKVVLSELDPYGASSSPGDDLRFLNGAYAAGAKPFFDILSARIDGGTASPYDRSVSADQLDLSRAILFRELLINHGDETKAVWLTHYGWRTSGDVSEQTQADFIVSGLKRARAEWPWSGLMFAWDLLPRLSPDDSSGYALLDANGGATAAFNALSDFAASGAVDTASTGFVPMDSSPVTYGGSWADQHLNRRTFKTTSETGASATIRFKGAGLVAFLRRSPQAGAIHVTIDGKPLPGRPVENGAGVIQLDWFEAEDIPVMLVSGLSDDNHTLVISLASPGQLTLGGLVVVRNPPLLWPVIVLLAVAGILIMAAFRETIYLIAFRAGFLQRRRGAELRPPLPRMPDWRPSARY
jgi:hypothetical protein